MNDKWDREKVYTFLELTCVFFWFLLDGCWLMEWRRMTYEFSVVALVCAGSMFFFIKPEPAVVLIAIADTCWLVLNVLWAYGDLSHYKPALLWSKILFAVGLGFVCLAFYTTDYRKRVSVLVLSRLRILRFFERGKLPKV